MQNKTPIETHNLLNYLIFLFFYFKFFYYNLYQINCCEMLKCHNLTISCLTHLFEMDLMQIQETMNSYPSHNMYLNSTLDFSLIHSNFLGSFRPSSSLHSYCSTVKLIGPVSGSFLPTRYFTEFTGSHRHGPSSSRVKCTWVRWSDKLLVAVVLLPLSALPFSFLFALGPFPGFSELHNWGVSIGLPRRWLGLWSLAAAGRPAHRRRKFRPRN